MASKWVDIQKEQRLLPNLQYKTAGDARVRPAHQVLNNIIKPTGDVFWNNYYPPNGWRCRCTVIQLSGGTTTPTNKDALPKFGREFMNNAAKNVVVFPPGHPYFEVSQQLKKNITSQVNEIVDAERKLLVEAKRKEYDKLGKEYKKTYFNEQNGGYVAIHEKHGKDEAKSNELIARLLAHKGEAVLLEPTIANKRSADALRNGVEWEFKTVGKAKNITRAIESQIESAVGQSANVLVYLDQATTDIAISKGVENGIRQDKEKTIKKVAVIKGGWVFTNSREDIERGLFTTNYNGSLPK